MRNIPAIRHSSDGQISHFDITILSSTPNTITAIICKDLTEFFSNQIAYPITVF